ncbi:hypothetical protein [Ilumatobacter sp.]|uniref:hypothetical protein n=1 Tax=Ilumatobacter sp. TaxID=1967498 RepID=UPI003C641D11
MAASKKKPTTSQWFTGETPLEELDPSKQVAHEIVQVRRDLMPSVDRIMSADLTEPQRHQAIGLFQASLVDIDDPFRNPDLAIEEARS